MSSAIPQRPNQVRDLVIRRARPTDAPGLVALVRQLDAESGEPGTAMTLAGARRALFGRGASVHVLLALLDRVRVAYALLTPTLDARALRPGFIVGDVRVAVAARKRGVQAAMIEACAAYAKSRGGMFLSWTSPAWDVDAHDFSAKIGAAEEPVMAHRVSSPRFGTLAEVGARHFKSVRAAASQRLGRKMPAR